MCSSSTRRCFDRAYFDYIIFFCGGKFSNNSRRNVWTVVAREFLARVFSLFLDESLSRVKIIFIVAIGAAPTIAH